MKNYLIKVIPLMGFMLTCGLNPQAYASSSVQSIQKIQQDKKITGHISDAEGPIIGASVIEKGTTNGVISGIDGNFSMSVRPGTILQISYIGYKSQEIRVEENRSIYNITLQADDKSLEEVVVVGYGIQKKKLVTGATLEVKGDDITKLNTINALSALQSQSPGVNIQAASGQPGDGFKVNIRGAGTNGNTAPLYVIDGVSGGNINNLNPSDIERIDVLKDAASSAIYGSAAANGVILITTKHGRSGKVQVDYDGNIGWQNVYRLPDMLTAKEYMQVEDLVRHNSGMGPLDWSKYIDKELLAAYNDGSNPGTNWLEEFRSKNAVTTSHSINLTGGSDKSTFSSGVGYQYQNGVFGNHTKSDYRRFTLRLNSEHVLLRNEAGKDIIKVGENVYFMHRQNQGVQLGNQYLNAIADMIHGNPLVPLYNRNGNYFDWNDIQASGAEGLQNFNANMVNPIYNIVNQISGHNKTRNVNLDAVGYIEIQPINNLKYRSQFSYKQHTSTYRSYLPVFNANMMVAGKYRTEDQVSQNQSFGWNWGMTHTLNYKLNINKSHHFDLLAGMEYSEFRPGNGDSVGATLQSTIFGDYKHGYLSLTDATNRASKGMSVYGDPYTNNKNMSYFGRLNYDYKETYLFSAIVRADGTSIFAPNHRWGYFPSFSAGWVISNERFMQNAKWLDFLKLRAGWGQNGNKNLLNGGDFAYQATFAFGRYYNYSFNNNKDGYTAGAAPSRLSNNDLTWETSEQTNIGIDARFFNQRFNLSLDWYNKQTKDLLVQVPIPETTGFETQWQNAGTVRNSGIEVALGWTDKVGSDFTYGINYNLAWNHNKVTKVNSSTKYMEGGKNLLAEGTGIISRFEEGHPIGYFYGYKTGGVIQNQQDLDNYVKNNCGGNAANSLQGTSLKPGDLMFLDTNHDGKINSEDKTDLGNPNPDVTMGLNLSAGYKGFDLIVSGYFALGQQVARSYRRFTDGEDNNYTSEVYSYWNGEGTSNKYPLLARMNEGQNWQAISDIYIENAGYFRLQNITLGYDFTKLWRNSPFQMLRFYVSVQNFFTITGYKGMDPENGRAVDGNEPWVTGVDLGNYPQPRTYMVGVNIKF
ncbi:TonB-dependent receptor [Bacteroidales bacterium KA00344]|nr:TonB-dependent receptor [Bacteroidales bacterium KA00344]